MKRSYLDYAMSVIIGRALPDVRDGLKPAHRRVLYAMSQMGLASNRAYRKCAKVIGEVIGNYHPHGDQPAYDTLVRLAQDFNMRKTLVDGQGNFGSVDGDPPAAYRYTEARLEALAESLMEDLDKATVDFVPNFDETTTEPTVFPATYPNLLVNGSTGIAVGMATNIPPHNLGEVIDGVVWLIEHTLMGGRRLRRHLHTRAEAQGTDQADPGSRLPHRRADRRAARHPRSVPHRPRLDPGPRQDGNRNDEERRSPADHRPRDPVSAEQDPPARAHRGAGARKGDRRHLRPARRVGSRRHAHRYRAEARRSRRGRAEQSLQAHPVAAVVRHHHAGHRGGAPEGAQPDRSH